MDERDRGALRLGAVIAGGLIFLGTAATAALAIAGYLLLPAAGMPRIPIGLVIVAACIVAIGSALVGYVVSRASRAEGRLLGAFHGLGAWGVLAGVLTLSGGALALQMIPPLTALATSTAIGAGSLAAVPNVWEQLVELRPRAQFQTQLTEGEAQAFLVLDKPRAISLSAIAQRLFQQVRRAANDDDLRRPLRPIVAKGRQLAGASALLLAATLLLSGCASAIGGGLGGTPGGRAIPRRTEEELPRAA